MSLPQTQRGHTCLFVATAVLTGKHSTKKGKDDDAKI
jgi:hypothetical protein